MQILRNTLFIVLLASASSIQAVMSINGKQYPILSILPAHQRTASFFINYLKFESTLIQRNKTAGRDMSNSISMIKSVIAEIRKLLRVDKSNLTVEEKTQLNQAVDDAEKRIGDY